MEIDQPINVYGIIGNPLAHTLSPCLHNALFAQMGIKSVFLPFETGLLEESIAGIKGLGIKGVSVTIPFKVEVMEHLDVLDTMAEEIGAVNTIVNHHGKLTGYNTDATGAIRALEQVISLNAKTCLVIGAGGAARAICFALKRKGCTITITNRSIARGEKLARSLEMEFVPLYELRKAEVNVVIQTTPVGMYPKSINQCVVDVARIEAEVGMDIIYNPLETEFIRGLRKKGTRVIRGIDMFVFQAAEQFTLWTGIVPPIDYMKEIVVKELKRPKARSQSLCQLRA